MPDAPTPLDLDAILDDLDPPAVPDLIREIETASALEDAEGGRGEPAGDHRDDQ